MNTHTLFIASAARCYLAVQPQRKRTTRNSAQTRRNAAESSRLERTTAARARIRAPVKRKRTRNQTNESLFLREHVSALWVAGW